MKFAYDLVNKASSFVRNPQLTEDAKDLFARRKSGHVGCWFYGTALNANHMDGKTSWEKLAEQSDLYDISTGEETLVSTLCQDETTEQLLKNIGRAKEYGPGTVRSVKRKSIPVLQCYGSKHYTAIDLSYEFARSAANMVAQELSISTDIDIRNFQVLTPQNSHEGRTLLMAFDVIANVHGRPGENSRRGIGLFLQHALADVCGRGTLVAGFNSETDEKTILKEYNDPNYYNLLQSFFFRLKEEVHIEGVFDPSVWVGSREWHPASQQLCHSAHPLISQNFTIEGEKFSIPAYARFHLSNSYRFLPKEMQGYAIGSGFKDVHIISRVPHHILIASI